MPEERFGLIADDLTGACDAGVQFAQRGFSTAVWLEPDFASAEAAELTVLSTNSRRDHPDVARSKVRNACRWLLERGIRLLYKKIDSTFEGNPGPEIEAVVESLGFPCALVTPAFPAMGRTVIDGRLYVGNTGAVIDLRERLRIHPGVEVVDAVSQRDLASIARAALAIDPPPLLVGSAGLAIELAALVAADRAKEPEPATDRPHGPVLLCIGSTNPVTEKQLERLLNQQAAVVRPLQPLSLRLALREGRNAVVLIDPARMEAERLAVLLDGQPAGALVLSGGDTALAVCRALGARGVRLEREIQTGIPWGRLIGGQADGMAVATKAGGFGAKDALVRVTEFLSGGKGHLR